MVAEMAVEEACIGRQQGGKREERRRESKCTKNAFIDKYIHIFRLESYLW
jgi:hypothetical protein